MTGVLGPVSVVAPRVSLTTVIPAPIRDFAGEVLRPSAGVHLIHRVRAWMFVPAMDFALLMMPLLWRPPQLFATVALAALGTALLTGGGRYVTRLHLSVLDELPCIVARLSTAVAAVATVTLYLHQKDQVLVFLETACQAVLLVIAGRVVSTRMIALGRRAGVANHRTVVIGGGALAGELARIVADHRQYGLELAGFVDDRMDAPAGKYLPRLGRLAELDAAVSGNAADTLLVADGDFEERELIDAVRTTVCRRTQVLVVPRLYHFHTVTGVADHIGSIPIMRIGNPNLHGPARLTKRAFDIVVASTALIALLPILITAALAVRVEGGPGVVFRQVRVGRDGKTFELFKLRSLRPANDAEAQTMWSAADDRRIGPVGRFLRRTSIDELPQLWNILRGDMTLVGPRPERPYFVQQFSAQFDRYAYRHRVQVGLTGFAQVSGLRGDTSIADRTRHDNFYIENWSLWLDVKIILRTFREVVFYRGA